jgi:hypothetical protein
MDEFSLERRLGKIKELNHELEENWVRVGVTLVDYVAAIVERIKVRNYQGAAREILAMARFISRRMDTAKMIEKRIEKLTKDLN